jgi:hypothetical protein
MQRSALPWLLLALSVAYAPGRVRADSELPSVVARFALKRADGSSEHLTLVRSPGRIEHQFLERGYSELWLRDERGELEHVRSFPRDGKSVHYTAGDLQTISLVPDWSALASLLGASELASLAPRGTQRVLERRQARVLLGSLRAQPARLVWLDDVALPAQLSLGRGKGKVVITLLSLSACTPALCSPVRSELRSLEFADLGDMEYDPFVRRFLAQDAQEPHGRATHR